MYSDIENFFNSLIKVNKNSNSKQRDILIQVCLEVLSEKGTYASNPVNLENIDSFSHYQNPVNKAFENEDVQVRYAHNAQSQLLDTIEEVLAPYLRKHNLSAVQTEMTFYFLSHSTIKDVCEMMHISERNVGYHRNEIIKKMNKNTFQEVVAELRVMFAQSFVCE